MAVARNVTLNQGANNTMQINVTDANGAAIDLTGYTANAFFKRHTESVNSIAFTTTAFANGLLSMTLSANTSSNTAEGVYTYIVKITHTATSVVTRIQEGLLTLKGE